MNTRTETEYIVIHCSATPPTMDIGAAEIDEWHRARGWSGIGYHYVIRRNGRIEPGRGLLEAGAHAKGVNRISVGVCWVGGVNEDGEPEDNRTPIQCDVLARLVTGLALTFPEAEVLGHRDLPNVQKACPSFDVRSWWEQADQRTR